MAISRASELIAIAQSLRAHFVTAIALGTCGVVGYHICFTRRRSAVRTGTGAIIFFTPRGGYFLSSHPRSVS